MIFRWQGQKQPVCNDLSKGMVIGLDAKMKIVYGWYSAENEESSEISKWKKKGKEKVANCRLEPWRAEL